MIIKNGNPYEMVVTDYNGDISRTLKVIRNPLVIGHQGYVTCHVADNITEQVWKGQILPILAKGNR
ncbi:hypothetical protein [Candidatus Mesenet endosymbiont of Agriotes lineatus]|uniref:hypothetical protein n=1 Tax=Candidatus Mesenet endosymbiont of Agriotes lineatus TaxID=3077948 RepID=UPI0030CBDD8D